MENTILVEKVKALLASANISVKTSPEYVTEVVCTLKNGYVTRHIRHCPDPENYSLDAEKQFLMEFVESELFTLEEYHLTREIENNTSTKEIEDLKKIIQKSLNLQTRIAKALNIIPMSEKEAKDLQVTQRKNFEVLEKAFREVNPEPVENEFEQVNFSHNELFNDVIGDDFLKSGGN